MTARGAALLGILLLYVAPPGGAAQGVPGGDPVLDAIREEAMQRSRLEPLAHALLDSIGPRLTGSPGQRAANEWAVAMYASWGIDARNEQYGTWRGWRRGISHIDLLEPRVRTLEGTALAWSPPTPGPVTAEAVIPPAFGSPAAFEAWLPTVAGKLVLISFAQPTCRPDESWREWATPESFAAMRAARRQAELAWRGRLAATGLGPGELQRRLDDAGAAGIVTSHWSFGWGVNRIFGAGTRRAPVLDLSCEDYGLVFRLVESGASPVLRVHVDAEPAGEVPVFNTIATIPGTDLPDEYVVLSAHLDSWDGASGATDNGTGTLTMMEAMRVLKAVYPNPRRTILAGHWSGEEQGLNGSRAFAADHPEVIRGMQALFNQDNGTGRVVQISMEGFAGAADSFTRWLARMPSEVTRGIRLDAPGEPSGGGTDTAAFVCHGAPAFSLISLSWDYGTYTWHTNRDSYDKIVFADVRRNVVLTAMLAYLASEDPERVPRARRDLLPSRAHGGIGSGWPACQEPARSTP